MNTIAKTDVAISEFFATLGKVLLRCGILSFALLLVWTALLMFADRWVRNVQMSVFGFHVAPNEIGVILYCFLGSLKLLALTFFWIPWLAIRWTLSSVRRQSP